MAKLEYDEQLVDSALNLLKQAENSLSNTGGDINSALTTILSARGIEYVDTSGILGSSGLSEACQSLIEQTITGINERVEMVKEYNEEIDSMSVIDRIFATGGMALSKFGEGLFTAGEQIVDGFASGLGFVAGIFSKDAKESIGEFVKKDHVGDFFNDLYDNELSGMVKASYMKENGLAANIFKIGGTAVGYSLALAAGGAVSGGVSAASSGTSILAGAKTGAQVLSGSLKAGATIAGIGGVGSGTQAGLQSGMSYNEALWKGIKTGAFQAGTVVAVNYAIKGISKAISQFKANRAGAITDDITSSAGSSADDIVKAAGDNVDEAVEAGSKAGGSVADEMAENGDDLLREANANYGKAKQLFKEGKITKEELEAAQKAAREAAKKYHPDLNSSSSAADDFASGMDDAGKAAKEAAEETAETQFKKNPTESSKVTADDSVDDIVRACNEKRITRQEFDDLMKAKQQKVQAEYDALAKQNPDGKLTAEQKVAYRNAAKEVHPDAAAQRLTEVQQNAAENAANDAERMAARQKAAEGASGSAGETSTAASSSIKKAAGETTQDIVTESTKATGTPGTIAKAAGEADETASGIAKAAGGAEETTSGVSKITETAKAEASTTELAIREGTEPAISNSGGSNSIGMTQEEIIASRGKIGEYTSPSNNSSTTFRIAEENASFTTSKASSPLNNTNHVELATNKETTAMIDELASQGKTLTKVDTKELSQLQDKLYRLKADPNASQEAIKTLEEEIGQYVTTIDGKVVKSYTPSFGKSAGVEFEGGGAYVNGLEKSANSSYGAWKSSGNSQQLVNMQTAGDAISHTSVYKITDAKQLPAVVESGAVTVTPGKQLPAVVESGPVSVTSAKQLPAVVESGAVTVTPGKQLPAVVESGPVSVTSAKQLPAVVESGPVTVTPGKQLPTVVESGPVTVTPGNHPPVVDPVPPVVPDPPVVITPVPPIPEPDPPVVITPIPPSPDPIPEPTPVIPTPIPPTPDPTPTPTPVVPTPVPPTPDPTPSVDPRIITPEPTPDPTPVVPTPVTPTPVTPTPVVPTPVTPTPDPTPATPTPVTEYAPIPATGIPGSSSKGLSDYAIPGIIGAAAGLAGIAGVTAMKNKNDKEEKEENR